MTDKQKAKAYDEALERIKHVVIVPKNEKALQALKETIFPELAESEDEKIRKGLIEALKKSKTVGELKFILPEPTREECIAYLEKQKEQKDYNKLYEDIAKSEWFKKAYEGKSLGCDYEQKESKPEVKDPFDDEQFWRGYEAGKNDVMAIFYQQSWYMEGYRDREFGRESKWLIKTGEGGPRYEENPRYGQSLTEEQKPANESNMHEPTLDEARKWNEAYEKGYSLGYENGRNEQKPVENINKSANDFAKEYSFNIESKLYPQLIGKQKELWRSEIEEAVINGFKKGAKLSKDRQKPAEWSEEDENMLNSCISSIEEAKENRYYYKETDGDTSYDHEITWLKSLRPQPKQNANDIITPNKRFFQWIYDRLVNVHKENPNMDYMRSFKSRIEELSFDEPHLKINKEQMDALKNVAYGYYQNSDMPLLHELHEQLKKLM